MASGSLEKGSQSVISITEGILFLFFYRDKSYIMMQFLLSL